MKQEKIKYHIIIDLGFTEEIVKDETYFKQFGYDYCIINFNLTDKIYLEWTKETQLCELIRVDDPKKGNILKRIPVNNIEELKYIIDFFTDKE